jgi:hypothetical protein
MVSEAGVDRPSRRTVGAVQEKFPVESTWQTIMCRTDKSKYVFCGVFDESARPLASRGGFASFLAIFNANQRF